MVVKHPPTGATSLSYRFIELNNQIQLLSLYEARSLKNENGIGSFDHIPIVEDDYEIIIPFYKEFHTHLIPVLSTVLLEGNFANFDELSVPNIQWNFTNRPEPIEDAILPKKKKHYLQAEIIPAIDVNLEFGYKYYALFKWFMTQNIVPALAQKYQMAYQQVLNELKSNIRHNNNSLTRASLPYSIF